MTPAKTKITEAFGPAPESSLAGLMSGLLFSDAPLAPVPPVNIAESETDYSLQLKAPGFSRKDFTVAVEGSCLVISAEKTTEKESETEQFSRREFTSKSFSRKFDLPRNASKKKIAATYKRGILELTIPKKKRSKPVDTKEVTIA